MNLRKLLSLLLIVAMLFTIAACSRDGKKEGNKDTAATASEEETVNLVPEKEILIWSHIQDTIIDEFCIDNPELSVKKEPVAGVFELDKTGDLQLLNAAMVSGDQPDAMMLMMSPAEAYYSNLFEPVEKYLENDEFYHIDDIDEGAFDVTTFNDIIYFIPIDFTVSILAWNKELLEEVGLDPDKQPSTWDEFTEICKKVVTHTPSGKIKTIGIDNIPWLQWHAAAFGNYYVDQTGLNFNWDTEEWLKTVEYAKNIYTTYGGKEKLSSLGDYRFIFKNTAYAGWNGAACNTLATYGFDYGIGTYPSYDGSHEPYVAANIGASYGIPKGAKNPAGGWKLATFHVTEGRRRNELQYFNNNPTAYIPGYNIHKPSREKIYETFEPLMDEELVARMKRRDELESSRNMVIPTSAVETKIRIYINDEFPKVLDNEIAPNDFLKNIQAYSDQVAKEFIQQKEAEGWVFEEGKAGIPPKTEQ